MINTFFSGDDFFHFKVALARNIIDNFGFYSYGERGIAFYRPIFREFLYRVYYEAFGLNPLPFRLTQIIIQIINIFLVYKIGRIFFKEKRVALAAAYMFGITVANVGIYYYLAGGIQAAGATLFVLTALMLFLRGKFKLSFGSYLLALGSHEISLVTTPLLFLKMYFEGKKFLVIVKRLWVYVLVTIVYLYLDVFVIGFSTADSAYALNFSLLKLINTYGWYLAWSLGIPEMTVDFVGSGLKVDPRLFSYWGGYYQIILPAFGGLLLILFWAGIRNLTKIMKDKRIYLFVAWFLVGLLPVAFLPVHKKTYYLVVSLPGIFYLVSFLINKLDRKIFYLFTILFLLLNLVSFSLAQKTFPAIQRGRISKKLINDFQTQYPTLPTGSQICIKNDPLYPTISGSWGGSSTQAYYVLNGMDGLQLLYKDNNLKVYYEDLDKNINCSSCIEFVAEIN